MSSGSEEMEAELMQEAMEECGFSLWHCENFAIPVKFLYSQFFAMIAKFRYHSENLLS